MRRCGVCNALCDDSYEVCVACGNPLTASEEPPEEPFSRQDSAVTVFHGTVVQADTRQYYQSGFTKVIRALFAGEPYQLGHTSHITVVRVAQRSGGAQAQDVVIYGGVQNILSPGDVVTVRTRRRGGRYVAAEIFSHTIDSRLRIEGNVAAGVVQTLLALAIIAIVGIVYFIANINYAAVGRSVTQFLTSLLPVGMSILAGWYLIRQFFR